jgi:hypothetical protein
MRSFGFGCTLRSFSLRVVTFFLVLITCVSRAEAQVTYRPITPFDIPGNTVQSQLNTDQREKAKQVFTSLEGQPQLTAGSPLHTLSEMPTVPAANDLITLRSGQRIDARALYLFLNAVEKALNKQGKTLRNPDLSSVDLDKVPNLQLPAPPAFGPQIPSTGIQEATPGPQQTWPPGPQTPAAAPRCNGANAKVDIDSGWSEINQILDGQTVSRCTLDFAPQLDMAESAPPVIPGQVTVASINLGSNDSRNLAQAYIAQKFTYNAGSSQLEFSSTLVGAFLGKTLTLGSIDAKVSSPKGSESTGIVDVKLGDTTAYNTSGSWRDLNISLIPNKSARLFDPWASSFQLAPGVNANFEVDVTAKYGLNGHIKTYKTAAYLDFKPKVELDVKGGLKVSAIIVSGGLDGTLDLISGDGDFGGVAAVFADTTASGNNPPLVAVVGPTASYSVTSLQGELHAYVRVALIGTVFSKKIMTWNGRKLASKTIPTFWSAYHISR